MYYLKRTDKNSFFLNFIEGVSDFIFPSHTYCICCGKFIDKSSYFSICDFCRERIGFGHIYVTIEDFERSTGRTAYVDSIRAAVHYGIFSRVIVEQFKNEGKSYLARQMSDIMWERIATDKDCVELFSSDFIVPAPMSSKTRKAYKNAKARERLYNHSAKLALHLSSCMDIEYLDCLYKKPGAKSQKTASGFTERFTSLDGSISLSDSCKTDLEGSSVILVDDVCTTGATLDACAFVLKANGAAKVHALVFATGNYAARGYF